MIKRICMWSGPRNISTAMMRSWENRSDCEVVDEPFYAFYLAQTQSPHPMFEEVLASQPQSYDEVIKGLHADPIPKDKSICIQYEKHMTHHMIVGCDMTWTRELSHCFLIRHPAQVVNSYTNSRGVCSVDDIGIKRQFELYQEISSLSQQDIPVIDANDVLKAPKNLLQHLCEILGINFQIAMLEWSKGARKSDGVWASHWYHSVENSTGFAQYKNKHLHLNAQQQAVVDESMPYFEALQAKTINRSN
ncbi:hypothetical protein [Glaciecola petra]|uniref:Sulfotransferase family protein n=1 Tax=Glaciecola petra TaxID=3075602 RepID=A0ABU2ZLN9_9ALTE|nr:hypothetical protein [Aestuariibacter sp. P117]MDT0593315.1 hypothetical protein [Aestuariibacter sp. P117]